MNKQLPLSEYQEAVLLAEYLDYMQSRGKVLLYTHIPHETYTKSWGVKIKNKKQGVRKGFPDYVILSKKKAIFLELKREKGGVISKEQREWIDTLELLGYCAYVARGFTEAQRLLERELN